MRDFEDAIEIESQGNQEDAIEILAELYGVMHSGDDHSLLLPPLHLHAWHNRRRPYLSGQAGGACAWQAEQRRFHPLRPRACWAAA